MNEEDLTELSFLLKAVSKKFECDYCHQNFDTQKKALIHVKEKHVN